MGTNSTELTGIAASLARAIWDKKQATNADTEWDDVLHKKGVLPSEESLKDLEKEAEEEERAHQQSMVKTYGDVTLEDVGGNADKINGEDDELLERAGSTDRPSGKQLNRRVTLEQFWRSQERIMFKKLPQLGKACGSSCTWTNTGFPSVPW